MTKLLLLLFIVLSHSLLYASTCPDLNGRYYCQFNSKKTAVLRVNQWMIENNPKVMNYTFTYRATGDGAEIIQASENGIPDSQGWTNYCLSNRLVSVLYDITIRSDFFRENNHLLRTENG